MKFINPKISRLCPLFALAASLVISGCATKSPPRTYTPKGYALDRGEYGGDLSLLQQRLRGPTVPGESNYYLDIWSNGELCDYARAHGLTNNHAFFVISHGGGIPTESGRRYAYYSDRSEQPASSKNFFSARDLAQTLGAAKVAAIHNLVIAGCNFDNSFSSTELRSLFPNATNIVHSLPGPNAHETLLRHALIYPSTDIKTLYLQPDVFSVGRFDDKWREKKAQPYVAELFLPGHLFPYKVQTAGRELLDHSHYVLRSDVRRPPATVVN